MERATKLLLAGSHVAALVLGFAIGIYTLPILTAPDAPPPETIAMVETRANFFGIVRPDLAGSDALHHGEGKLYVAEDAIAFTGELTPGPDYHLYLSPIFVETKAAFEMHKQKMVQVGKIRSFDGFILDVPEHIDPFAYRAAIVWCEQFEMFITATAYR